jgi:putative ABC transport system permease protein
MLQNFFKIALRNILKNKGFSFINIFGLAIGMACSLLIFLFVQDETSYDTFHKDASRIHRVVKDFINDDGGRIPDATTPAALAPAMQREIPEVEKIARLLPPWNATWLVRYGNKKITEDKLYRVDSSFFDVFTFPFVKGDPKTVFNNVNSIVITESVAKRYFGKEDPIGKVLQINPGGDYMVGAVIKDVPSNAHFHFDFLLSWRTLPAAIDNNWGGYNFYTYAKVKEGTSLSAFEKKIQDVYERNQQDRYSDFYTQPLTDIHLTSNLKWELEPNGDKTYVNIFTIIGLFILLIAAINYVNLSTAKSSLRAKEIGVRKVSGAVRGSLIRQFLLESIFTCIAAALVAVVIAQLLSPLVNSITQKSLVVAGNPVVILYTIAASVIVGIVAGLVPALYLSAFKPIAVLKGFKMNESGALNLRKTLVVVQFTISIGLIIGALIIAQQIQYIQSAKLGFDRDQLLVIRNTGFLPRSDRNAMLNSIRQIPGVKKAAGSNMIIGSGFSTTRLRQKSSEKEIQVNFTSITPEYLDVVGIELKEGRIFSQADTMNNGIPGGPLEQTIGGIVLNETAVKDLELGNAAVGKQLVWGNDGDTTYYLNIIGVVKDFHFTSLRNEIKPFGFVSIPAQQGTFSVKLAGTDIQGTIKRIEKRWNQSGSERPFDYIFLDENFSRLYASEARFQKLFISLVVLGILIACLGLLGLAAYAAQQRVKEIGIRKTLGASVTNVVALLSKDFLRLVVIALVLAIPISWYAMNKWLRDFHYRINIEWWIFLLAGILAIAIAFATISLQTIRAARANPVKSLRTE